MHGGCAVCGRFMQHRRNGIYCLEIRSTVDSEDGTPTAGSHTSSIMLDSGDVRLAHVSRNAASLWATSNDQDLSKKVLEMLQHVLTFADLFVILACDEKNTRQRPQIVHWLVSQKSVKPSVSRDLVTQAVTGGQPALLMDVDENGSPARFGRWSFCVPVKSDAATPWCICIGGAFRPTADYGRFLTVEALKSDVIVTELVSHLIGAVRSVRSMEKILFQNKIVWLSLTMTERFGQNAQCLFRLPLCLMR